MKNSRNRLLATLAAGASVAVLASAASVQAQTADAADQATTIDEIIVTAQRRDQNLQDVPITVASLSSEALTNARVTEMGDVAKLVPGLRSSGDTGTSQPIIRGVGNLIPSAGNDGPVSFYVDGVYIPQTLTGLLAINQATRVEVLKGPQGTLFGRNATAGLIQITTRRASDVFEAEAEVGYANFDTTSVAGFVAGPLTDRIGASLSATGRWQNDGWGTNAFDNSDVRLIDSDVSARAGLYIDISDQTELVLRGDYQRSKATGLWALGLDPSPQVTAVGLVSNGRDPWDVNMDSIPKSDGENWGVSATLRHDFDFATLSSITAYRDHFLAVPDLEFDATPLPLINLDNKQYATQFSQELQLTSAGDGPFSWTAGVYYLEGEDSSDSVTNVGPILQPAYGNVALSASDGQQSTESISVYVQGDYEFATRTTLTLGARYTEETRELVGPRSLVFSDGTALVLPTIRAETSADVPTWRVALRQELTDDVSIYGSVSKGFKSGGFNLADPTNPAFDPEELLAYEAGFRSMLADGRLRLNSSIYFYEYDDLQINGFNSSGTPGLQYLYNAASAEMYGLDVDFLYRVTSAFTLSGGVALFHGEYTDFTDAVVATPNPAGGNTIASGDVTGNDLPQSPELQATLVATYELEAESGLFILSGDVNYNSGYFYQPANQTEQDAYALFGASVRFEPANQPYYVQLWGKNLANEAVRAVNFETPFSTISQFNAPRTFGVTLGVKF